MLAYSSISQAGYVLVGVQAGNAAGTASTLFYLLTYVFIVMGTFAVVSVIQGEGEARNDLGAIRGLARRSPRLAAAMLILLLAQAGIPFTSGFLAKFYVISAVIQRGQYPLAVIAMLAAAIAAFFYLRVGLLMYLPVGGEGPARFAGLGGPSGDEVPGAGVLGDDVPGVGVVGDELEPIDAAAVAGLEPVGVVGPAGVVGLSPGPGAVAVAGGGGLAGGGAVAGALEAPAEGPVVIPLTVSIALVICVAFTIFAGVSNPVIDFARHATTLF
jgi:NADH:ubiquinone oxidoreductase subunit 5 (subunit L)/multisubunit Na+/H+ antiporter MnhA subunit